MVSFDDYVAADLILLDPPAADREALLDAFVERLKARDVLEPAAVERLRAALYNREMIGSTGIGDGVALPHAYLPGVRRSVVACARLGKPIDFEAPDYKPVDLAFLIAGPPAAIRDHLQVLAHMARMFKDVKGLDDLRRATTPRDLLRALMEIDARTYEA